MLKWIFQHHLIRLIFFIMTFVKNYAAGFEFNQAVRNTARDARMVAREKADRKATKRMFDLDEEDANEAAVEKKKRSAAALSAETVSGSNVKKRARLHNLSRRHQAYHLSTTDDIRDSTVGTAFPMRRKINGELLTAVRVVAVITIHELFMVYFKSGA